MALSLDEVRRIAVLARLRLSPEEEVAFGGQLSAILDHVAQLGELDVSGVEPMTHAVVAEGAGEPGAAARLREDALLPGLTPDEALAAAPAREGTCFKVPRIIE
jgi:aspartyl-tRNA(Asn)/glutamyl-tRNA(Gln) amidotransferase subunit C